MADILETYRAAHLPLSAVLGGVDPAGWDASSPCEGWTARDVVGHLVRTQREFLRGHAVTLADDLDVDLAADPARAWQRHAQEVVAALTDPDVPTTQFQGWDGPTTVGVAFGRYYVFDMLVHRWDVARAVGATTTFSGAELDAIERGIDSFGDALYMEGICRSGVTPPEDADRQDRLLARLGRPA